MNNKNIDRWGQQQRTAFRRMPAEWERQAFVQLTWPHSKTDWKPYLDRIIDTMTEIAIAIAEREELLIVAQNREETENWLKKNMTMKQWINTNIVRARNNDTWARDHAFITVYDYPTEGGKLSYKDFMERNYYRDNMIPQFKTLLDFKFNGWGEKFSATFDDRINRKLRDEKIVEGKYEDNNDFVLEGGSIESDGKGTIFTTKQCLMAKNRNKDLTMKEIEEELKGRLGADRVVWLHHGKLKGDDTDGHIDTIVRIAPRNTIVYIEQNDPTDEHYEDFEKLKREIRKIRTREGEEYKRVALPFTDPILDEDNKRLPATYANYLVINGAVIVPIYNQPKNDRKACQTIAAVFPEREIIPIDARTIIRQHGSIHCLTMQYY